jgi:hypothetical protein
VARHKNETWQLSERPGTWEEVSTGVLMDIRDELQTLNRLLGCKNFLEIPQTLKKICMQTKKRKYVRKPKP